MNWIKGSHYNLLNIKFNEIKCHCFNFIDVNCPSITLFGCYWIWSKSSINDFIAYIIWSFSRGWVTMNETLDFKSYVRISIRTTCSTLWRYNVKHWHQTNGFALAHVNICNPVLICKITTRLEKKEEKTVATPKKNK